MIKTYIIEALASQALPNGRFQLVLDETQATDLQVALSLHQEATTEDQPTLQDVRSFFFHEEGYMADDAKCKAYWWAHND